MAACGLDGLGCLFIAITALPLLVATAVAQERPPKYDYPTAARADFVIGCLLANNYDRQFLEECACEVDDIANHLPYDDYDKANVILGMQAGNIGREGALFRDTPMAKTEIDKLRRAQAEANLDCS